jgi:hypothetical protein
MVHGLKSGGRAKGVPNKETVLKKRALDAAASAAPVSPLTADEEPRSSPSSESPRRLLSRTTPAKKPRNGHEHDDMNERLPARRQLSRAFHHELVGVLGTDGQRRISLVRAELVELL